MLRPDRGRPPARKAEQPRARRRPGALARHVPGLRNGAFHLTSACRRGRPRRRLGRRARRCGSSPASTASRSTIRRSWRRRGTPAPTCRSAFNRGARMMRRGRGGAGSGLAPAAALRRAREPRRPRRDRGGVFRTLGHGEAGRASPVRDRSDARRRARRGHRRRRNDLETAAIALAPAIGEALAAMRAAEGCRLAHMSGSGATVFGLFDDRAASASAAKEIGRARPGWWIRPTRLR